jgi:hypothetical protein
MTVLATLRSTERRLAFWRSVCGCHAGALAVLVASGWVVTRMMQGAALTTASALRGAAVVVGAGIAAKLAAILAARVLHALDAAVLARRARRSTSDERVSA